jgi:hypothetical protein
MMPERNARPVIAVAYRSHGLGIAVLRGNEIVTVHRHRLTAGCHVRSAISKLVHKAIADHATTKLILEENSAAHQAMKKIDGLSIHLLSLPDAKRRLLPKETKPTHMNLFQHLLDLYPQLGRLVTVLRLSRRIAINEARRTVPLLAVALGLAAHHANASFSKSHHPSRTL